MPDALKRTPSMAWKLEFPAATVNPVRRELPKKAPSPILITDAGIVMDVNSLPPSELAPIDVRVEGRLNVVRGAKVRSPGGIDVTPSENVALVTPLPKPAPESVRSP